MPIDEDVLALINNGLLAQHDYTGWIDSNHQPTAHFVPLGSDFGDVAFLGGIILPSDDQPIPLNAVSAVKTNENGTTLRILSLNPTIEARFRFEPTPPELYQDGFHMTYQFHDGQILTPIAIANQQLTEGLLLKEVQLVEGTAGEPIRIASSGVVVEPQSPAVSNRDVAEEVCHAFVSYLKDQMPYKRSLQDLADMRSNPKDALKKLRVLAKDLEPTNPGKRPLLYSPRDSLYLQHYPIGDQDRDVEAVCALFRCTAQDVAELAAQDFLVVRAGKVEINSLVQFYNTIFPETI